MNRNQNGFLLFLFVALVLVLAGVGYGVSGNSGAMRMLVQTSIFPMGAAVVCLVTSMIDMQFGYRRG